MKSSNWFLFIYELSNKFFKLDSSIFGKFNIFAGLYLLGAFGNAANNDASI